MSWASRRCWAGIAKAMFSYLKFTRFLVISNV
jgi:hypothetical protein